MTLNDYMSVGFIVFFVVIHQDTVTLSHVL